MQNNSQTKTFLSVIKTGKVMTLATISESGAWSAPVYYHFDGSNFYFFSSETSRHIQDTLAFPLPCAASIFEDHVNFEKIKGIQMSGRVFRTDNVRAPLPAITGYIKKFGISILSNDPLEFFETHYHAKLFKFVPEQVFWMDNAKGLGTRVEICL